MGVTLEETKESKHIGVYIQNDPRWNAQVNYVKSKASKLKYSISSKEIFTIPRSQPSPRRNIKLSKILNVFKTLQPGLLHQLSINGRDRSVTSLKESLGWLPLQERRRASRLTCLYKMLNRTLDIDHRKYITFNTPKIHDKTQGHGNQFQLNHTRTDVYANLFFPKSKTIKEWNDLPSSSSSVISTKTTAAFKAELSNHLTPNLANRPKVTTQHHTSS